VQSQKVDLKKPPASSEYTHFFRRGELPYISKRFRGMKTKIMSQFLSFIYQTPVISIKMSTKA